MLRLLIWLTLWLLRPKEATMPDPFARDLDAIDEQLADIARLNDAARHELVATRSRITEQQAHELNLIAAVDARNRRADRLLDERLHAQAADRLVTQ